MGEKGKGKRDYESKKYIKFLWDMELSVWFDYFINDLLSNTKNSNAVTGFG